MAGATVEGPLPAAPSGADAWILSRLQSVVTEVDALYDRYEFAKIVDVLYHFAWDEVCDWYIELAKLTLDGERADDTRRVLGEVLDTLLRLLHPMIPFVTEALWTVLTGGASTDGSGRKLPESLVVAEWPVADVSRADAEAEREIRELQHVVTEVRRFRSDQGIKPAVRIPASISGPVAAADVRALCRLTEPGPDFAATGAPLQATSDVSIAFDLTEAIDVAAERARLGKDRTAAVKERDVNAAKLGNPAFTDKAPEAVVAKVRERLAAAEADLERIDAALAALPEE
jgi:valyl-tRNA synthetase